MRHGASSKMKSLQSHIREAPAQRHQSIQVADVARPSPTLPCRAPLQRAPGHRRQPRRATTVAAVRGVDAQRRCRTSSPLPLRGRLRRRHRLELHRVRNEHRPRRRVGRAPPHCHRRPGQHRLLDPVRSSRPRLRDRCDRSRRVQRVRMSASVERVEIRMDHANHTTARSAALMATWRLHVGRADRKWLFARRKAATRLHPRRRTLATRDR